MGADHPGAIAPGQASGLVFDYYRLVIPLSSATCTELTENPRDHQRKPTADVMLKLSRLATIAPLRKVVDEELANPGYRHTLTLHD
jgi:hypothetical protein